MRKGFEDTNNDIKRQERGVALLAGQYKRLKLEGRALGKVLVAKDFLVFLVILMTQSWELVL